MKNVLVTIASVILSIVSVNGQNRVYENPSPTFLKVLDSNDIFYVGIVDRYLLSQNKNSENPKFNDIKYLEKFDSIYGNIFFKTVPDTNYVIMKRNQFYDGKTWEDVGTYAGILMTLDDSDIVGIKTFDTPKSNVYKKITVYEVVTRGGPYNEFHTSAIFQKYDGTYGIIWNL